MKCVILCGGLGTRMRPYTYKIPKPMLPLENKPILWYVIENARKHGITDLLLMTGYLHEKIEEYFGDGKKFGVSIEYVVEDEPKNTAGCILSAKEKLRDIFLVLMGDHFTNINLKALMETHKERKPLATIAIRKHTHKVEYGVVDIKDGVVKKLTEKPVYDYLINTGMYVCDPRMYEYIEEKEDFAKDVFPKALRAGEKIAAHLFDETWTDIGLIAEYEKLKRVFSKTRF